MFDSSTTWLGFGLLVWMWRTMFAATCYVRNNQRGKLLSLIAFSLARSFCVSFYFNHYCLPLVRISVSVYLCYCFIVTACKWKKYMKNYYFSLSLFLSYLYSISNLPPPPLSLTHTHIISFPVFLYLYTFVSFSLNSFSLTVEMPLIAFRNKLNKTKTIYFRRFRLWPTRARLRMRHY